MSIDLKSAALGAIGAYAFFVARDLFETSVSHPRKGKSHTSSYAKSSIKGGHSSNVGSRKREIPLETYDMKNNGSGKAITSFEHLDHDMKRAIENSIMETNSEDIELQRVLEESRLTNYKVFNKDEVVKFEDVTHKYRLCAEKLRTRIIDVGGAGDCCPRSLLSAIKSSRTKKKPIITAGDAHTLRINVVDYAEKHRETIKVKGCVFIDDDWLTNARQPLEYCDGSFLAAASRVLRKRILVINAEGECLAVLGRQNTDLIVLMHDKEHYMFCSYSKDLDRLWKDSRVESTSRR